MCGAEEESRCTDAIQVFGAASEARNLQGEAEAVSSVSVEKCWETRMSGYICIIDGRESFLVPLIMYMPVETQLGSSELFALSTRIPLSPFV